MMKRALTALLLAGCTVPSATRVDVDAPDIADGAIDAPADAAFDARPDAAPDAMMMPATLSGTPATAAAFGDVVLGQTSSAQGYTITNDGDLASGALAIALDDPGAGFAIGADTCSGQPLTGHHACAFTVTFTPGAAGSAATTVRITGVPGGEVARDLGGNGLQPGAIDLVEHGWDFGTRGVDAGALTHTFDVVNGGQVAIGAPQIAIGGATDAYFLDATTCAQPLAPKAHCQVTVRFDPATVGAKAGSLTVTSSPGGSDAASLGGTGVAHVTVTRSGTGAGSVASNQPGLDCGAICDADFSSTPVTLEATTPAGSTFTGWSGDCAGTGSCTLDLTGAKHVTATFTAITPPLGVAKLGGGAGRVTSVPAGIDCGTACGASFAYGTMVTLTATPAVGSSFGGWSGACSGTGPCVVAMDQARSVAADFDAVTPPLSITIGGTGGGAIVSKPDGIACAPTCGATFAYGTVVTLTATATTGSGFTAWGGACTGTNATCTVTMDQARAVTATFDALTPTLTVAKSGAGNVTSAPAGIDCGTSCSASFAYATAVTLTPTATTGAQFTGWSGACTGTGACTVTMDQARTVSATFAPFTPVLTVTRAGTGTGSVASSPAGIACGTTCSHAYAFGDVVMLTATTGSGSTFTGWTGACSGTGACTVTMDQARSVTATFDALTPTITVSLAGGGSGSVASSPAGIDCGTSCNASFTFGATVTLTATAQTGSTFAGWSGACTGTASTCMVVADRARAVTAQFDAVTPPLSVTLGGGGAGAVTSSPAGIDCGGTCTATFAYGASVTLTPAAATGSTFAGWSGACSGVGTCTVAMTQARSVGASFTLNSYTLATATTGTGTGSIGLSPTGGTYPYGTVVVLTAAAATGSSFAGWTGDCAGTATSCTLVIDQNRSATATFTLKTYPVTITTAGSGTVASQPSGTSFAYGTVVNLTATPQPGSHFVAWSGDACAGSTSTTCTFTVDGAKNLTATFALNSYDLMVTRSGNGTGAVAFAPGGSSCGAGCATYPYGTVVMMTATASTGSTFAGWSGSGAGACAGSSSTTCTLTIDQSRQLTATFTLDSENLTLATAGKGGGTIAESVAGTSCGAGCTSYPYATTLTLTATAQVGSTFTGWSGDAGTCVGQTTACTIVMDRPRAITATFAPVQEQLTWGTNGAGTGAVSPTPAGTSCGASCATYDYGATVTLTAAPQTGSTFAGWSGACTNATGTCTATMTQAQNVTARFDLIAETLTWSNPGTGSGTVTFTPAGTSCGAGCATFGYGATVTLTAAASTGSTFVGWGGACAGTSTTCTLTMTQALSATARFDLIPEQLTWTIAGAGTVSASPAGTSCGAGCATFPYGQVVTLTASPQTGSTFTGWSGAGCSGNGTCVVTMTSGQSVTATFALQTEQLTWTTSGAGTGTIVASPAGTSCGAGCLAYSYGASVTITPSPATGSSFAGWSGACTGTGACTLAMSANRTLGVAYTLNTYTVSASVAGGGTISSSPAGISCGGTCSASWTYGTAISLTAAASPGWSFAGWSGACSGTSTTCPLTVDTNKSVTATFAAITPTLTVGKGGNGAGTVTDSAGKINCGGACSATYAFGQGVTLTASPSSGSSFAGWSGGCAGTGTCTVTMDQARNVTASFSLNSYPVNVAFLGDAGGSVSVGGTTCSTSCAPQFLYGTVINLSATANAGAIFDGWGGMCSGNGVCTIVVGVSNNVSASFGRATYNLTVERPTLGTVTGTGIKCGFASTSVDCAETYARGTFVDLTISGRFINGCSWTPIDATGCVFDPTTDHCTLTMDGDADVVVTYDTGC